MDPNSDPDCLITTKAEELIISSLGPVCFIFSNLNDSSMKNLNSISRLFAAAIMLTCFFVAQSDAYAQGVPFLRWNALGVVSNNTATDQVFVGEAITPPTPLPGDKFTVNTAFRNTAGAFATNFETQIATGVRAEAHLGTNLVGVDGIATDPKTQGISSIGVRGTASGGYFNVGVWGISNGDDMGFTSIGVRGEASNGGGNTFAGYFVGDVFATGMYLGSDRKLKKDIADVDGAMGLLMVLQPKTYNFRTDEFDLGLPEVKQYGLIAQEVEAVFPELIKESKVAPKYNPNQAEVAEAIEFKSVNYIGLIPVLIKGVQEQQTTLTRQEQEIADLKAQLSEIRGLLAHKSSELGQVSQDEAIVLNQNAPNPFAESTRIAYSLPEGVSNASMIVYGLNGQTVASFDLDQSNGEVTVYGNDLQSGIYSYSLIADGQVIKSRKMIVTK